MSYRNQFVKNYLIFRFILLLSFLIFTSCSRNNSSSTNQNAPVVVDINGSGDYLGLELALAAGEKNIYVKDGLYELTDTILITVNSVVVVGESKDGVILRMINNQKDLLVIKSNDVVIKNLTLDTKTHNAQAALVEAGGSNILIDNNNILGGENIFSIYFAGPPVSSIGSNCEGCVTRDETINVYIENGESSFDFSMNNIVSNNYISSEFVGDGASFSLQKNGEFINNILDGAMLSVYMDKDCVVSGNTINNSLQHGIYLTFPSENILLSGNKIRNPRFNGIVAKPQYAEHGHQDERIISENIIITDNIISSNLNGINAQGYDSDHSTWGRVKDVFIENNIIEQFDFSGIWLYDFENTVVKYNEINFSSCTTSTQGTDVDGDGSADIPTPAARDSAGIWLYDRLIGAQISNNSISKLSSCNDIAVAQNAITISNASISSPGIENVQINSNSFSNLISDWMHSSDGIDIQNSDVSSEVSSSGNSNIVTVN